MGAIAFQKGLGVVHSCAHALSTVADLHHGFANGLMIETGLRFNVPAVPERFRILAQTVGLDGDGDAFLRWLSELKQRIGIPRGPVEAGVAPAEMDRLTDLAFKDTCHLNNPRPCTTDDFGRLWREAFGTAVRAG
jgi:alcohol dehydrogenase class IV